MDKDNPLKMFTEFLYENEKAHASMVYLRQPINGVWHEITWAQTMERTRKIVTFLKDKGLKKGDRVAILSKNCAEWFMADFAIAMGGYISVPIFATQHKDIIRFILDHADVKLIFVGKLDNWQQIEPGIPAHVIRVAFPYENAMPAQYHWDDILSEYKPDPTNFIADSADLFTIVYTSGTTGNSKGVMITYGALRAVQKISSIFRNRKPLNKVRHYSILSYLPLAHIYERISIEYASMLHGDATISFVESLETFQKNLQESSVTFFLSVPRIWTQFQKSILAQIPQHKLDKLLKIPLISYFIKKKIRKALGLDKSLIHISGAAPISASMLEWYSKIGIEITEGYGRTEDLSTATWGEPGHQKFGTVGKPWPGVHIKIDENGEVLTKSEYMMLGYYKDKEATKKAFTKDGYLRTGDLGKFDDEGNLIILGRVSDPFKTDKGEFVNPVKIEHKFAKNHYVDQLCCIGLNLPHPIILVVLSEEACKLNQKIVEKSLKKTWEHLNHDLTKFEKVSHVIIVNEPWTPENALLTPTLKLRRHAIHARYVDLARKFVETSSPVIWE